MKTFNSLNDITLEIKKKDLEKKITIERMKLHAYTFKEQVVADVIVRNLAKSAGKLLGRFIQKN